MMMMAPQFQTIPLHKKERKFGTTEIDGERSRNGADEKMVEYHGIKK